MIQGGLEVGDYAISARATKSKLLKCDGAAYSRATYADLFAVIGAAFGAGDGSTTFNVPDPQGRALVMAGAGSLAESFAAAAVTVAADTITVQSNVDRWITGMKVRATTTGAGDWRARRRGSSRRHCGGNAAAQSCCHSQCRCAVFRRLQRNRRVSNFLPSTSGIHLHAK